MNARLFVLCGLPGSGKTTRAKELAARHDAVRFSPDEWMVDLWDEAARALIEARMWELAQHLLRMGMPVVVDYGSWSRAERDELREFARSIGVPVELHYLDAPIDELERRVLERNREGITRAHLEQWAQVIAVPDAEELALYDPPLA